LASDDLRRTERKKKAKRFVAHRDPVKEKTRKKEV